MAEHTCQQCQTQFVKRGTRPYRFCTRTCADEWARRDRPSDEWLRGKYEGEGLTANDIAQIVQRDPKRVWEWLRDAGIQTRPRGSYNTFALSGMTESPAKGRKHTPEAIARITEGRRRVPREAYAGNGHYLRGLRGENHPNWKGGHTPERQAFYATPEWRAAARAAWARDLGVCQRCTRKAYRTKNPLERWHLHHIVSFSKSVELRAEVSNLVTLCPDCHRWVHSNANTSKEYIR
jgi:hypothetical protein